MFISYYLSYLWSLQIFNSRCISDNWDEQMKKVQTHFFKNKNKNKPTYLGLLTYLGLFIYLITYLGTTCWHPINLKLGHLNLIN